MAATTATSPPALTGLSRGVTRKPLRREEVLAFILEQLARGRGCPSFKEIGDAVGVKETRARQLVDELIKLKIIGRTTGLQRNLVVRDVTHAREIFVEVFRRLGGTAAAPLGDLVGPCAQAQLPIVAVLEHIAEHDADAPPAN
jgi:hypothetical protein